MYGNSNGIGAAEKNDDISLLEDIEYGEAQGFEQRRGRDSEPHFSAISDF
jgi:hypothetical protein